MRSKQLLFYAILVALVLALVEAASAAACGLLVRRGWMAQLPRLSDEQVRYYLARRNPLLGWGPAVDGAGRVVRLEPRPDPSFPDTVPACASAYGESFTAGSEVGEDGAYPHVLGVELGCRVANYGVGASGSDQALMLVRAQRHLDRAPVVVLGHISENILRNVNQYRVLLYPDQELYFKPRFLLGPRGELRFVPVPVRTAADLRAVPDDPERFLPHDAFLARTRPGFPYLASLVRWGARDFHVRAQLAGIPRHLPFYDPRHPAGGLALTTAVLSTFAREAKADGRRPLVVLMPVGRDLVYARRTGRWPDQPLADALARGGVPVLHAGPEMLRRIGPDTDPCTLFADCSSHYNAAGYRLFAEVVRDRLRAAGYFPEEGALPEAPGGAAASSPGDHLGQRGDHGVLLRVRQATALHAGQASPRIGGPGAIDEVDLLGRRPVCPGWGTGRAGTPLTVLPGSTPRVTTAVTGNCRIGDDVFIGMSVGIARSMMRVRSPMVALYSTIAPRPSTVREPMRDPSRMEAPSPTSVSSPISTSE